MKIKLTSIFVNDQNKAFDFYTKILGFAKKADVSAGKYRWLTVVSKRSRTDPSWFLSQMTTPPPDPTKKPFTNRASPRPCSSLTIFRKSIAD